MSYKAVICRVVNIRPIEGADRIVKATCSGYQVVLGKHVKERELGVFFESDGKLSHEMLSNNNLYRHVELNKDPKAKAGFFDDNGRVRAQKLRGEISDGFWCPLSLLSWTEYDLSKLKEGDEIDVLKEHRICEKYYTPATLKAMNKNKQGKLSKKGPRLKDRFPSFREHYDVGKLRNVISTIPNDQMAIVYISEKCHGCVDKNTLIETLEWGPIRIKEIVEQKQELHIKSLNTKTGKIEYAKIEDWYFYPDDEDWYKIELEDGRIIKITGNNPVWLPELNCYRRVDELTGDEVLLIDDSE